MRYESLRTSGKKVELRPLKLTDYSHWLAGQNARLPVQNAFDHPPLPPRKRTRAFYRKIVAHFRSRAKEKEVFFFGIFDMRSGIYLGHVDFYFINQKLNWVNLGFRVHNHEWGRGYATEAARLALKLGFGPLDFYRIEASCDVRNKASARVARKAGLVPEGLRRKFFPDQGGTDMLVFGMNAMDYRRKKRRA